MSESIRRFCSRTARIVVSLLAAGAVAACGSDGGNVTDPGNGGPGPEPAISLQLQPANGSVQQGGSGGFTATVTRSSGFSGAVTVAVEGAPSGVAATVAAPQTSGVVTTASVTIDAAGTAAPGGSSLTVRATGPGVNDATATFALTVTEGDSGGGAANVSVDFRTCLPDDRPIWLAFQDGSGPWTRVSATDDVYHFRIDAAQGGTVWVSENGGQTVTFAQRNTRAEMTSAPVLVCNRGTKSASGTVAGLSGTRIAAISLGDGSGFASVQQTAFELSGIRSGPHDLVAYRFDLQAPGTADRAIIRRDIDVPDGGSVGSLDFESGEAFAPATANVTVTGADGAPLAPVMGYYTGEACTFAPLYFGGTSAGATFAVRGIPADRQRATDFHALSVSALSGATTRVAVEIFRALGDRTIALGPGFSPTVTSADGPYRRLRAAFTIPGAYLAAAAGGTNLLYTAGERTMSLSTSFAVHGGSGADVTMPDLSGAEGWNPAWAPVSGAQVQWFVQISGSTLTGSTPPTSAARTGG